MSPYDEAVSGRYHNACPERTWVMSAASSRSSSIASAALYMVAQPQGPPAHGYAPTPCNSEAASRGRARDNYQVVRQR